MNYAELCQKIKTALEAHLDFGPSFYITSMHVALFQAGDGYVALDLARKDGTPEENLLKSIVLSDNGIPKEKRQNIDAQEVQKKYFFNNEQELIEILDSMATGHQPPTKDTL